MQPETVELSDPGRPSWTGDGPRPVRVHLWRPQRPSGATVLVSHGTGGAAVQLAWLAEPLAAAGFLVLGVDHHGNNYVDGYAAEGFARWWERPRDLTLALDAVGEQGPVGAAGFSLGGYTAAALLGARIDASRYAMLFSGEIRLEPPPEYPTVEEELRARLSEDDVAAWVEEAGRDYSDARVGAAYLICPPLGRLLDEASLAAIDRPVAVRWTDADEIEPPADNAELYAALIPGADATSVDPEAGHYAFLADEEDHAELRERVAQDALAFFEQDLR